MAHLITQPDADFFFSMEKLPEEEEKGYEFPSSGEKLIIPFVSLDRRESFLCDINRGQIRITKITYQNRVRKALILRRLDLDGSPHVNPEVDSVPLPFLEPYNGMEIPCPHLHIYVEGFGERWAVPANDLIDMNGKDIYELMLAFFRYCNVIKMPNITKTLLV